jgi:hypothetical protein
MPFIQDTELLDHCKVFVVACLRNPRGTVNRHADSSPCGNSSTTPARLHTSSIAKMQVPAEPAQRVQFIAWNTEFQG